MPFKFYNAQDCDNLNTSLELTVRFKCGSDAGSSILDIHNYIFQNRFLLSKHSDLFSANEVFYLGVGFVYAAGNPGYEIRSSPLVGDSFGASGIGIMLSVYYGVQSAIFEDLLPAEWLLGLEVRYLPLVFQGLGGRIQDWQFAVPIRLAVGLW